MVRTTDPFKKAKPPAAKPTADDDKGTTWMLDGYDDDPTKLLKAAITDLSEASAELKTAKVRFEAAQDALQPYAENRWLEHWIKEDDHPETPVRITNPKTGEYATFVVQDKTNSAIVTPKMMAALIDVFGVQTIHDAVVETVVYSFNQSLLGKTVKDPITGRQRPIQRMLVDRIGPLLDNLVANGELTRAEADSLLTAKTEFVLDADFVPSWPTILKKNIAKLRVAVDALGSAIVRFIKPS
jgi:hypothetical protein